MKVIDPIYVRVECIKKETSQAQGGYMCAIMLLFSLLLKVSPDIDDGELARLLDESQNPLVQNVLALFMELGDIPKPPIYEDDKVNYVCLYTADEFYDESIDLLQELASLLMMITDGKYSLRYKQFFLEDKDIIYRDPYQVVISKEVYENYKNDYLYSDFGDECDGF